MRRARFAPGLALALSLCLGAALWTGTAKAAPLDLVGTWYVLVHYKDSASNNPDVERWQDAIWVFERSGSRLKWTEYPIVVFDDDSGRFERTSTQYARVMHFWEPSPKQLEEIKSGLSVNPRGSKRKTLSGSAAEGWRSRTAQTAFSANTLTYSVIWSVEDPTHLPVFTFEESLGGARAKSLEGVTRYRTTEVTPDGELHGSFDRDGTRTGTFRMMRSGSAGEVTKSRTQAEMRARARSASSGASAAQGLAEVLSRPGVTEKDVREHLMSQVLSSGQDPKDADAEIRSLSEAILAELHKGTAPAEIERKVRDGTLHP